MGVNPLLRGGGLVLPPSDGVLLLLLCLHSFPDNLGVRAALDELELLELGAGLAGRHDGWAGDDWAGCSWAIVGGGVRVVWTIRPSIKILAKDECTGAS